MKNGEGKVSFLDRAKKGLEKASVEDAEIEVKTSEVHEAGEPDAKSAEPEKAEYGREILETVGKYEEFAKEEINDEEPSLEEEFSREEEKEEEREEMKNHLSVFIRQNGKVLAAFTVSASYNGHAQEGKNGAAGVLIKDGAGMMKESFARMKSVKSYSYDGKIKFYYKYKDDAAKSYNTNFEIKSSGVVDKSDAASPDYYSSVAYNAFSNIDGSESEADLAAESIIMAGKEYLRPGNFVVQGTKTQEALNLEKAFKDASGKWYSVTPEEKGKFYEIGMRYFSLPSGALDPEGLGRGSADDLSGILSDDKLLSFAKDLGSEKVGSEDTVHYQAALSTQEAFVLAAGMMEAQGGDGGAGILDELKKNADGSGSLKQAVDSALENVKFGIWIGKGDKLAHRFRISGSFDREALKKISERLKEIYGDKYKGDAEKLPDIEFGFDFDYTMDGYGTSKVTEPEAAVSLGDVLAKISGGQAAGAAAADTDKDGLTDEKEKVYGTDSSRADTDGDGYTDGDEVKKGFDPLVSGSARLDYDKLDKAD
jgi:hypothetical protein